MSEPVLVGKPGQSFGITIKGGGFGNEFGVVVIGGQTAPIVKWSDNDIRGVMERASVPGQFSVTTKDGRVFTGDFRG